MTGPVAGSAIAGMRLNHFSLFSSVLCYPDNDGLPALE